MQNVVFALSNAATKGSTAARKALIALGLDRLPHYPQDGRWAGAASARFRHHRQHWDAPDVGLPGPPGGARSSRSSSSTFAEATSAAAGVSGGGSSAVVFSPRTSTDGPESGGGHDSGVLGALLLGVAGLASEPIRGLDEGERCLCGAATPPHLTTCLAACLPQ